MNGFVILWLIYTGTCMYLVSFRQLRAYTLYYKNLTNIISFVQRSLCINIFVLKTSNTFCVYRQKVQARNVVLSGAMV